MSKEKVKGSFWLFQFQSGRSLTLFVIGELPPDIFDFKTITVGEFQIRTDSLDFIAPSTPPKDKAGVVTPLTPAAKKLQEKMKENEEIRKPDATLERVKKTYKKAEESGEEVE